MSRREWNGNRRPGSSYHYLKMDREFFELSESLATPYLQKASEAGPVQFLPDWEKHYAFLQQDTHTPKYITNSE